MSKVAGESERSRDQSAVHSEEWAAARQLTDPEARQKDLKEVGEKARAVVMKEERERAIQFAVDAGADLDTVEVSTNPFTHEPE